MMLHILIIENQMTWNYWITNRVRYCVNNYRFLCLLFNSLFIGVLRVTFGGLWLHTGLSLAWSINTSKFTTSMQFSFKQLFAFISRWYLLCINFWPITCILSFKVIYTQWAYAALARCSSVKTVVFWYHPSVHDRSNHGNANAYTC